MSVSFTLEHSPSGTHHHRSSQMTAKETPTAHLEDAEMISKIAIEEESLESKA